MKQMLQQQIVQWIFGGGIALVLSAAAHALPSPEPMGSRFYRWFYVFTQGLLANYEKARQAK